MPLVHSIEVDGPGSWYIIHLQAAHCDTEAKIVQFILFLQLMTKAHYCDKCRKHLKEYLERHRDTLSNIRTALEMLHFTYALHEDVNQREGKSSVSWADVQAFYYDGVTDCSSNCKPTKKRAIASAPNEDWAKRVRVLPRHDTRGIKRAGEDTGLEPKRISHSSSRPSSTSSNSRKA